LRGLCSEIARCVEPGHERPIYRISNDCGCEPPRVSERSLHESLSHWPNVTRLVEVTAAYDQCVAVCVDVRFGEAGPERGFYESKPGVPEGARQRVFELNIRFTLGPRVLARSRSANIFCHVVMANTPSRASVVDHRRLCVASCHTVPRRLVPVRLPWPASFSLGRRVTLGTFASPEILTAP
jgi:hypothetical protein